MCNDQQSRSCTNTSIYPGKTGGITKGAAMAAPMAGAAARGIAAALAGHLAGGGGGAPAPPGGGGHHRVRPSTALIIAIVVGVLVALASFIALGLSVAWLWGFVVAILAGPLAAFGLFAWMIHPPTPPAAPAPAHPAPAPGAPAPGAAPAAGAAPVDPQTARSRLIMIVVIGVMVGCILLGVLLQHALYLHDPHTDYRGIVMWAPFTGFLVIGGIIAIKHLLKP